jgi:hypothetical protein
MKNAERRITMTKKSKPPEIEMDSSTDSLSGDDISAEDLDLDDAAPVEDNPKARPDTKFADLQSRIYKVDKMPKYIKAVIFGKQKSGKTTFASTAPNPIIFNIRDNGLASVRGLGLSAVDITSSEELIDWYWYLKTAKHEFGTVAFDTATQLGSMVLDEVSNAPDYSEKTWGKKMAETLNNIVNLYASLPMHVIFNCQRRRTNEEQADYEGYEILPWMSPSVRENLCAIADVIGYTYLRSRLATDAQGREVSKIQYCMRLDPSAEVLAGIRIKKGTPHPSVLVDPTFPKLVDIFEGRWTKEKKEEKK